MSDDWRVLALGLIAAMPPTVAAVASMLVAIRSRKSISELHLQINSRMDEFMTLIRKEARAEGRAEGVEATVREEGIRG